MEDSHDTCPMDWSLSRPASAEPTLGDMTGSQASNEMAGELAARDARPRAPGKRRSNIWNHFEKLPGFEQHRRVKCLHCDKHYVCNGSSTGNLWKHIKKAHPDVVVDQQPAAGLQRAVYSHDVFREALAKWIVATDQPFTAVDHPSFQELVYLLHPDAKLPSNDTARRDIAKLFKEEKERVGALLRDAPGCLSFTADVWTSPNGLAFLGITVHWIDWNWKIHSLLMDIPPISGKHTGENLSGIFQRACDEFGVLHKLLAVTTDSASNNNTFMRSLKEECQRRGILFDHESRHVRCMAHVIHLAVGDFLNALNSMPEDSENAYGENYIPDPRSAGFIPRLRKLVVEIRSSVQRREQFARQCEAAKIRPKELVVDVRTRWNSTYDMIERALELRKPLDEMAELVSDLRKYKLTDGEWKLLVGIHKFFGLFKVASNQLCATSYPTLAATVPVYNFMIDRLEDYRDTDTCPAATRVATDAAIDRLKQFYVGTDAEVYTVATILDPHHKLDYYHNHHWEREWIELARRTFDDAYAHYRAPPAPDACEMAPSEWCYSAEDNGHVHHYGEGMLPAGYFYEPPRITERDEFKEYLGAQQAMPNTSTLQWWETNGGAYPSLEAMARNYLTIPATSIPAECAFSGGTDLVHPKRGALKEDIIRACMCLKSWLELPR
jgi:hypothetical protein